MNWAPFAVYNPELWHWPETWPLCPWRRPSSRSCDRLRDLLHGSLLPGHLDPAAAPGERRTPESFVWRHPW